MGGLLGYWVGGARRAEAKEEQEQMSASELSSPSRPSFVEFHHRISGALPTKKEMLALAERSAALDPNRGYHLGVQDYFGFRREVAPSLQEDLAPLPAPRPPPQLNCLLQESLNTLIGSW